MNTLSTHSKSLVDFSYGTVLGFCIPSTCHINSLMRPINKGDFLFEINLSKLIDFKFENFQF